MTKSRRLKFLYKIPANIPNVPKWDPDNIFRDRDFLLLWISQVATLIGGSILGLAVALLSGDSNLGSHHLSTSGSAMGLVILVNNLPSFFLAFIAGVMADMFDRKKIMLIANITRVMLLVLFLALTGWEYIVFAYIVIFLKAGAKQFFIPAEVSLIPDIVKKKNIMTANSLFNLTNYTTYILGFIFAGPLLIILGPVGLIIFLIIMFIISSIAIFFVRVPRDKGRASLNKQKTDIVSLLDSVKNFYKSFIEGFKYIAQYKVQRIMLVHNLVVQSLLYVVIALVFKLGSFLVGITPDHIGFLTLLPLGVGIIISIVFLNLKLKHKKRVEISFWGVSLEAFGFSLLMIASFFRFHLWDLLIFNTDQIVIFLSTVGTIFIGFGFPFMLIPSQTLIQEKTHSTMLGRVYGIWLALSQAIASIPAVIFGYFADYLLGVPTTLVWITIIALIYSIILFRYRNLA